MRIELTHFRRAVMAEMHRRRAAWLRSQAADRTMSAVSVEMTGEAGQHEEWADALMDYTDASEKPQGRMIVQTPDIDLAQTDEPKKKD